MMTELALLGFAILCLLTGMVLGALIVLGVLIVGYSRGPAQEEERPVTNRTAYR